MARIAVRLYPLARLTCQRERQPHEGSMYKLASATLLVATVPSLLGALPAAAGGRSAYSLSSLAAAGVPDRDGAVVFVGGKGGSGGTTGGGMGGGTSGGGMSSGGTTGGGMSGGASRGGMNSGGGMGGGRSGFDSLFGAPAAGFGATDDTEPPGNAAQPAYYTYQCITPVGQCSFVAPAALRSSALRAGAGCSCQNGQSQGQVK
jgi:hypothetical protein